MKKLLLHMLVLMVYIPQIYGASYILEADKAISSGNYDQAITLIRDRIRGQENRAKSLIKIIEKTTPPSLTSSQLAEICRIKEQLQGNPRTRVENALGAYQVRTGVHVPCDVRINGALSSAGKVPAAPVASPAPAPTTSIAPAPTSTTPKPIGRPGVAVPGIAQPKQAITRGAGEVIQATLKVDSALKPIQVSRAPLTSVEQKNIGKALEDLVEKIEKQPKLLTQISNETQHEIATALTSLFQKVETVQPAQAQQMLKQTDINQSLNNLIHDIQAAAAKPTMQATQEKKLMETAHNLSTALATFRSVTPAPEGPVIQHPQGITPPPMPATQPKQTQLGRGTLLKEIEAGKKLKSVSEMKKAPITATNLKSLGLSEKTMSLINKNPNLLNDPDIQGYLRTIRDTKDKESLVYLKSTLEGLLDQLSRGITIKERKEDTGVDEEWETHP